MKRLICLLLPCVLLLLSLTACDLRNRQDSENFIPTGQGSYNRSTTEYAFTPQGSDASTPLSRELVKTVLSYTGEIPFSMTEESYSYQLPMIDLSGAQAVGCNAEIEARYGALIEQSIEAVENYENPVLLRLSYTSFTIGGILTLRIDETDLDGETSCAYYTMDADSGEAVSMKALFDAAGLSGNPQSVVEQSVEAVFTNRFGPMKEDDPAYTTALNRTQSSLLTLSAKQMHLTQDGRLAVAVEIYNPNGSYTVEELLLPLTGLEG